MMADSKRICSAEGCDKHVVGRGVCRKHYGRLLRTGTTDLIERQRKYHRCAVDGCDGDPNKPGTALGYCQAHYYRFKRHGDPLAGAARPGERLQWLREHANFSGVDCLIFPYRSANDRGRATLDGQQMNASRAMCWLAHGEPPTAEHYACQNCRGGDDGCVNPRHLRWDTPAANQADRIKDETSNRGSRHGLAKLTERQVRRFRRLSDEVGVESAANECGISLRYARRIARGARWAWLE